MQFPPPLTLPQDRRSQVMQLPDEIRKKFEAAALHNEFVKRMGIAEAEAEAFESIVFHAMRRQLRK